MEMIKCAQVVYNLWMNWRDNTRDNRSVSISREQCLDDLVREFRAVFGFDSYAFESAIHKIISDNAKVRSMNNA